MSWILSEAETRSLRDSPDGPAQATVYRNRQHDLIALVYCNADDGLWNLLLSVAGNRRDPHLYEALEARLSLLPGIENFTVSPKSTSSPQKWLPNVHLFHLTELPEEKPAMQ